MFLRKELEWRNICDGMDGAEERVNLGKCSTTVHKTNPSTTIVSLSNSLFKIE